MKKISGIIIIAIALVAVFASCKKERTGTFQYKVIYQCNKSDTSAARVLVNICKEKEYFKKPHEYKGTHSDCATKALADFFTATSLVGDKPISSHLQPYEFFRACLLCIDCGQIVGFTTWTPDYFLNEDGVPTKDPYPARDE